MKIDKSTIVSFILLIVIASLYRVLPGRPFGFAPQIAMALFAGSVVTDKRLSFLLPILSLFISDVMYEVLYRNGLSTISGFYDGQLLNYALFAAITVVGFNLRKENVLDIIAGSLVGATAYFVFSNFGVWLVGGLDINSVPYPKTAIGFVNCLAAGVPFYKMSVYSTLVFSTILFGGYYLVNKYVVKPVAVA
ncbi:MAG TPA: DUF6580 family putative transport protein [Ferruginibacter sp.]|nr:DUF6580 family putative transport protein [Ferruginibacter sp.]